MRKLYSLLFLLFLAFRLVAAETPSTNTSSTNKDGIVQVLETEVWEASSDSWKASGGRWTNEMGQASLSPSELKPPEGFDFVGDWKIVVSNGDSMGWEYQFQYLRPPKRRRIWLRSLKQQKQQQLATISKPRPTSTRTSLSRTLARIRDDYNFKGFGLSFYKSLLFLESFGFALRLPLTTNFDWLDRHPELPSVSSSVAFYFPWTISASLSGSVRIEWIKWVLTCVLGIIPRLLIFGLYELVLPLLWIVADVLLFPIQKNLPPLPKAPSFVIANPRYKSELSERIGCSVSYRWSKSRGLEWRFDYWHSYLPTLVVYRKLLKMNTPFDWWQKHFGSIGLSTGYPVPTTPYYSCSACLSLSGLYWKSQKGEELIDGSTTVVVDGANKQIKEETISQDLHQPSISSRLVATTKAESLL